MATIDITAHLVPSRYDDEPDRWHTAQALYGTTNAVELRMNCRYTRRIERFSVLYQGPGGTMRLEHGKEEQPGPSGSLICQATVISATVIARAVIIDVFEHDVLVLNGQRMVILDDRPQGYPRLVTEAEAGLARATETVRAMIREACGDYPGAPQEGDTESQVNFTRWQTRREVLDQVWAELRDLAGPIREQYAAPAKR